MPRLLRLCRILLCLGSCIAWVGMASPVDAQDDRPLHVTLGVGAAFAGPDEIGYASLVADPWAVRGVIAETVREGEEERVDLIWDIGVLRLIRRDGPLGYLQAGIGLAVTGGERDFRIDRDEDPTFITLGVPLQAVAFLTPVDWLGVGVGLVGNVNLEQESLVALMAGLSLGRVRP